MTGTTVGIFGFGGVGRAVAQRATALGMDVLALRRTDSSPQGGQAAGALRAADRPVHGERGIELLSGAEGLRRLLAESDHLVLCAPETAETTGVLNDESLRLMKRSAVVINVSRGGLIVEPALVDALREGRIRGAALDVFATEPLPSGHAFWTLPQVLVTPHVSAISWGFWAREAELIAENARRYLRGTELLNRVDPGRGY